jgi:uncharacterized protein YbbK (DUF523 family)
VGVSRRPRIGISSCLLGEMVRWDGGHKRNALLIERLDAEVEWVAVCPEMEIGLGAPREPIDLVRMETGIALMTSNSGRDLTETMRQYAEARVDALGKEQLSGYVLKSDSPSCGPTAVRVLSARGDVLDRTGRGLFAEALMRGLPDLPIEEDTRLNDLRSIDGFMARVRAFQRTHDV